MIRKMIAFFLCLVCLSCNHARKPDPVVGNAEPPTRIPVSDISLADSGLLTDELTELKRGDILVKANHNWWPGTSFVNGGMLSGHAAIVLNDVNGKNTEDVLSKAVVFETNDKKVPAEFQVRKIQGLKAGHDPRYSNTSFDSRYKGIRYRLRMQISKSLQDSILAFILSQDDGRYSYSATKSFDRENPGGKLAGIEGIRHWYCSLLIWQAYYYVLGVDIDSNGGVIVYPNDLINSPCFNNQPLQKENRVRF